MDKNCTMESQNNDKELWRKSSSFYSPRIFLTGNDGIGIDVGGRVIVMPVEKWHSLALNKPDNKIHVTADDLLQIWLHKKQPHEFMPDGEPSIALDKTEKKYCECEEPNRIIKTYMECRGCGKSIKSSRSME